MESRKKLNPGQQDFLDEINVMNRRRGLGELPEKDIRGGKIFRTYVSYLQSLKADEESLDEVETLQRYLNNRQATLVMQLGRSVASREAKDQFDEEMSRVKNRVMMGIVAMSEAYIQARMNRYEERRIHTTAEERVCGLIDKGLSAQEATCLLYMLGYGEITNPDKKDLLDEAVTGFTDRLREQLASMDSPKAIRLTTAGAKTLEVFTEPYDGPGRQIDRLAAERSEETGQMVNRSELQNEVVGYISVLVSPKGEFRQWGELTEEPGAAKSYPQ